MEDGLIPNGPPGSVDDYMMVQSDDQTGQQSETYDDIMHRRLKNRERQRRFRAKKRLQAQHTPEPAPPHQAEPNGNTLSTVALVEELCMQPNANVNVGVKRVYCSRKWKKEARNAHKANVPSDALTQMTNGVTAPAVTNPEEEVKVQVEAENLSDDPVGYASLLPISGQSVL